MSLFTPATIVPGAHGRKQGQDAGKQPNTGKSLRSRSSIAAIVDLVRDPLGTVGSVYQAIYESSPGAKAAASDSLIADSKRRLLYLKLQEAASYDAWRTAAKELDELEGNNAWKADLETKDYDYGLVASRLGQLEQAKVSGDVGKMLFLVRTGLTRDLGDMGNAELYRHSHTGTKDLIERYIDVALDTLNALLEASTRLPEKGPLSHRSILEQVISARQAFGRSALLLSGGGTFGMSHNGVLKVLWEQGLLPRIISGASAGSIVSAVICTRTDEEMPDLLEQFCHGDLAVFEEEGNEEGVMKKVARFLKHGHLYDITHLERVMKDTLGDLTFQEAYNRTRRILNICVSSASLYELPRLLNYVTAPNVLIWSAVAASCSVPLVFSPASLLTKDPRTGEHVPWNPSPQGWIDGSVENDLPMTRLAEMFNVNHFIVSQVNPHVIPFIERDEGLMKAVDNAAASFSPAPHWLHTFTHLAKGEALYRLRSMAEFGIFPNALTKAASILNQKYSGDITIVPAIEFQDFTRILKNPTEDFMVKTALMGERATWPKLSRVRNHCAIELALDDAVAQLRARVVFSSSQIDLRMGAYTQAKHAAKRKHGKHSRAPVPNTRQQTTPTAVIKPMTRTKRSMSQNSEPDASLIMAAKGVKPKGRPGSSASGASGLSAKSEKRPSSIHIPNSSISTLASTNSGESTRGNPAGLSSNTSILRTAKSQSRPPVRIQTQAGPKPCRSGSSPISQHATHAVRSPGLPDISSSGAETSGLYTSEDSDAAIDSDASATSTEPTRRRGSYGERAEVIHSPEQELFPHATQPNTPLVPQGYRPFNLMLTPASPPNALEPFARGPAGGTPGVGPRVSSKKARTEPSGPELKYKQLFHSSSKPKAGKSSGTMSPKARASPPASVAGSSSQRVKRINALGIDIPLPMRKKAAPKDMGN